MYTTATSVCIRLKLKSTLAVIGQYDLWVKRGVVSVSGAKLHPSPRLHRVYAPSTHSLPIVKCVTTSGEYAEVELRNVAGGPHELERLSPLFDRIKNSTDLPKGNPLRGLGPYTFSIVSPRLHLSYTIEQSTNSIATASFFFRRHLRTKLTSFAYG